MTRHVWNLRDSGMNLFSTSQRCEEGHVAKGGRLRQKGGGAVREGREGVKGEGRRCEGAERRATIDDGLEGVEGALRQRNVCG